MRIMCTPANEDAPCLILWMSLQAVKGRMMPSAGLRLLCCVSHDIKNKWIYLINIPHQDVAAGSEGSYDAIGRATALVLCLP